MRSVIGVPAVLLLGFHSKKEDIKVVSQHLAIYKDISRFMSTTHNQPEDRKKLVLK